MRVKALLLAALLAIVSRAAPDVASARAALERAAASDGDANAAAEALYLLGEMDDEDLAFAPALAHYDASFARSPSNRYAPRAMARASTLRAHAEGAFAPYARLEKIRRDPALANDARTIDAFATEAEAFPAGKVRVEARMLVAEAYLGRMGRPSEGLEKLWLVTADTNADVLTARQAARQIVDTLIATGELEAAETAARELRTMLDPKATNTVQRLVRRRAIHRVALADLIAVALLAAGAVGIAARRRALPAVGRALRTTLPVALLFAAYAGLAGGWLASQYESGNGAPFFALALATLGIALLARAWGAAGSTRTAARVARAAMCGSSVVAAGFLILERIDPAYLDGYGL